MSLPWNISPIEKAVDAAIELDKSNIDKHYNNTCRYTQDKYAETS